MNRNLLIFILLHTSFIYSQQSQDLYNTYSTFSIFGNNVINTIVLDNVVEKKFLKKETNTFVYIILDNNNAIIVKSNHIFKLTNGSYRLADRLRSGDELMPEDSIESPKFKINNIYIGSYISKYQSKFSSNTKNIEIHLGKKEIGEKLPVIGTNKYNKINFIKDNYFILNKSNVVKIKSEEGVGYFIVDISNFNLPKTVITDCVPKINQSINNKINLEKIAMIEKLFEIYKSNYKDVFFVLMDKSQEVNATAGFYANYDRYIMLYGGLVFNTKIKEEVLGLFISHELGHHFGGAPLTNSYNKVSCEGQADYYATSVVQKNVWGTNSLNITNLAINQWKFFFEEGLFGDLFHKECESGYKLCGHPCAKCRIETFECGRDKMPKPSCAGYE